MSMAVEPVKPLAEIDAALRRYIENSLAPNTRKSYGRAINKFFAWCKAHNRQALPASGETVAYFLVDISSHYKPSTLNIVLAAISTAHQVAELPNPRYSRHVMLAWAGIKRTKGVAQAQKTALVTAQIGAMVQALPDTLTGMRDRALILFGFAGAFRCGELQALTVEDLDFTEQGVVAAIRRSKTDQEGEGMFKGIPYGANPETCPVIALRAWLDAAGITTGPVFRPVHRWQALNERSLSIRSYATIIQRAAERVGLKGDYSGLSLRSGFATSAVEAGLSIPTVMRQTGHKSPVTLMRYVRHRTVWQDNPAGMIGL